MEEQKEEQQIVLSEEKSKRDRSWAVTLLIFQANIAVFILIILMAISIDVADRIGTASDISAHFYSTVGIPKVNQGIDNLVEATNDLKDISGNFKQASQNILTTSESVNEGILEARQNARTAFNILNSETIPQINNIVATTQKHVDSIGQSVTDNLTTLNTNQKTLGDSLTLTRDQVLPKVMGILNIAEAVSNQVKVYVDDPEIADILKSSAASMKNVEVITGNMGRISQDSADKVHSLLYPPKPKGVGGFLKRYILEPVKQLGGVTYLILKLVNGF